MCVLLSFFIILFIFVLIMMNSLRFMSKEEQTKVLESPVMKKLTNKNCKLFTEPLKKYYDKEKERRKKG